MAKLPTGVKVNIIKNTGGQSILCNITITRSGLFFIAWREFWKNLSVKPIILKPFMCLWFSIKFALSEEVPK